MGSGRWSPDTYHVRADARARTGADTFAHSSDAHRTGNLRPHQTLDPQGLGIRESRDSDEHPDSNAIIISLDVTGSMGAVLRGIHADLPRLHEMLLGHRYIADPQILFAAVGDATCDSVPLQVGQFESDNRMDQNLENMLLEGGGGGQQTESYELMLYVAARHTATDCWEKRRRKGYLFMIGDEMAYPALKRHEIVRLIGPAAPETDVALEQLIAEVRQRYHLFYVIPGGASNGADRRIIGFWEKLLGPDHVLRLKDPADTSECIAQTIGLTEGVIDRPGLFSRAVNGVTRAINAVMPAPAPTATTPAARARRL